MAVQFDRRLGSVAAEMPVEFHSDQSTLNTRDFDISRDPVVRCPRGGGTRSGFIRGCAAPGSEPLPYFRENRTPKTYPILIREISQSRAPEAVRTPKTYPILGNISQFQAPEAVRTQKTYPILEKFDKITPYFREIW